MRVFATTISNLFNPLFVPLFAAAYILFGGEVFTVNMLGLQAKAYLLFLLFFFMLLLPLGSLLFMKYFGMIENVNLPVRKQRLLPFGLSILFYGLCFSLLNKIEGMPSVILHLVLSGIVLLIVALLFTLWFQISIHTMCMGSFVAIICFLGWFYKADSFWILMAALLISGLVGFSRLALNAHKPYQIYCGFVVGLMIQYFSLLGFSLYF